MNSFRHFIGYLIGILLIFLIPQIYYSMKIDILSEEILKQQADELVDTISKQGRITKNMLLQYQAAIDRTRNVCHFEMIHRKFCLEPEYRFRTMEEILSEQDRHYKGENIYHVHPVETLRPKVHQKEPDSLLMTKDSNASIMERSVHEGMDPGHIHTEECYYGHGHSGSNRIGAYHKHYVSCRPYVSDTVAEFTCPYCKKMNMVWITISYWQNDQPQTEVLQDGIEWMKEKKCTHCSYPITNETIKKGYMYSCGFVKDLDGDGYGDLMDMEEYYYPDYYAKPNTYLRDDPNHRYVNGCYCYHRNTQIEADTTWDLVGVDGKYAETLEYKSFISIRDCLRMIKENQYEKLCYIPRYFELYYGRDSKNRSNQYLTARYETVYSSVGELYFRFVNAHVMVLDTEDPWRTNVYRWGYITEPNCVVHGIEIVGGEDKGKTYTYNFPETLTPLELYQLLDSYSLFWYKSIQIKDIYHSQYYDLVEQPFGNREDGIMTSGKIVLCSEYGSMDGWKTICGLEENKKLVCNEKIRSIVATHPIQNLYVGNEMLTTVRITYQNGEKETKVGVCEFDTTRIGNDQRATIHYVGRNMSGTMQTFLINATITVLPNYVVCGKGHTYWLNDDGTDPGCPYCNSWLASLAIVNPADAYLEIIQGSNLESQGVKLRAVYLDGRVEYLTSGYLHNLDNRYIGIQNVTIGYKGKTVILQVKVQRRKRKCLICKNYYELYPDGTDPGCPHCLAKLPIFTGNILKYFREISNEEILYQMEVQGEYRMSPGDEIKFHAYGTSETLAMKIESFFGIHRLPRLETWVCREVRDGRSLILK